MLIKSFDQKHIVLAILNEGSGRWVSGDFLAMLDGRVLHGLQRAKLIEVSDSAVNTSGHVYRLTAKGETMLSKLGKLSVRARHGGLIVNGIDI